MSQEKPISVRLDEDQKRRLQQIAKAFRTKEVELIRWAIDGLIEQVKRDQRLVLPFRLDDKEGNGAAKMAEAHCDHGAGKTPAES
jgi:hypothetical protein